MPTYGLTTTGFVPKTFGVLQDEMNAALRAAFGNSINLTNGILAKFRDIICERYTELWEELESVYGSQDPDKATGTALEALCALTGTLKNPATSSVVTLTLTGNPATLVNEGSRAATSSTSKKFATDDDATITLASSWAAFTPYALGARVTNSSRIYQVTVAGTSGGLGGPTTTATGIPDGSVTWDYLGEGTGVIDVTATCVETGAVAGFARDITVIDTPVGGWQSVINVLDATEGSAEESDEDLRTRRELELAGAGSTTVDAIRAAILEIEDVIAATVFVNNTDLTDADGVPPHAVECLVRGGDNQDIFDCLFANVAAGVATHASGAGAQTGTSVDSQGTSHTMKFTRPIEVQIYVAITLIKDPAEYPANGDTLVKEAIVAWGDEQATGKNVVSSALVAQAFSVPGVLDVTICNIGTAPAPVTSTTVPIALRELAVYDTIRITVSSSNGTP